MLSTQGRLLVVGFAAGQGIPEVKVNRLLLNNVDVRGVGWGAFAMFRPGYMHQQWAELVPMLESGVVKPPIGATYDLDGFAQALLDMDARKDPRQVGRPRPLTRLRVPPRPLSAVETPEVAASVPWSHFWRLDPDCPGRPTSSGAAPAGGRGLAVVDHHVRRAVGPGDRDAVEAGRRAAALIVRTVPKLVPVAPVLTTLTAW